MHSGKNNPRQPLASLVGFLFLLIIIATTCIQSSLAVAEPLSLTDVTATVTPAGLMEMHWKSNVFSDSTVEYSTDDSFSQKVRVNSLTLDHSVMLSQLIPNTLYHYHVVSTTPEGEQVVGPHLLFNSPTQADLAITHLQFRPSFQWYDGSQPLLGAKGLDLQITNQGQEPITNNFSISLLISQSDETVGVYLGYSCFAQYDHTTSIPGQTTETILLDTNIFAHCDTLTQGNYSLIIAADYDDQVNEGDETNNVSTLDVTVGDRKQAPEIINFSISDTQATSTAISFEIKNVTAVIPAVVDVAPDYYTVDHPGSYLWSQDVTVASSTYSTLIQGLQAETLYHVRLRLLNSNYTSDDYTVRTVKDLRADENRLLNLKLQNPSCRVVDSKPLSTTFWQDLGLNIPHHDILRYRIWWDSGTWSPWYTPGSGDEDWQMNTHGNPRRVWSYFQDHSFEYETCGLDISSTSVFVESPDNKNIITAPVTVTSHEKYGQTIDRGLEAVDPVIKHKIKTVQQALRFYKSGMSVASWQVVQDAYVYGGYRLSELEQTLRHDTGGVHPTIPAVAWRKQLTGTTRVAVTKH